MSAVESPAKKPVGPARQLEERDPDLFDCRGIPYIGFLAFAVQTLQSQSYFEIGTASGRSLASVGCKSVAVDPKFSVTTNVIGNKSSCMFFQMRSDRFFEDYNLTQLLGGPFDVAFLDGLHVYEYLLRDFINTERHAKKSSIVFLHDCLPFNLNMTRRRMVVAGKGPGGSWTGDVWKVLPILKKYRPDLSVHLLDCPPTGLVMITGLDPRSIVLDDNIFNIIDEFKESPGDVAALKAFRKSAALVQTREIRELVDLAKYCW